MYQTMCVVGRSASLGVGMFCQLRALCKALGKRNGFEDDVVAQQPPHTCLVVHNTVCHVTPCVFPFPEPETRQCCSQEHLCKQLHHFLQFTLQGLRINIYKIGSKPSCT